MSVTFSVIIPVFNKQSVVEDSIQSVLNQDYSDFELVVVDDGSTDSSLSVIENIDDRRMHFYHINNSGPSGARNYGINQAQGEWILFLDADDLLIPGALKTFNDAISSWPVADIIVSNFYDEAGGARLLHVPSHKEGMISNPFKSWFNKCLMPCAGAFICKRELLRQFHYNEKLRRSEDNELMFNLFRIAKVASINTPTMTYRHQFSSESKKIPPIEIDFKGHLSFDRNKTIWEKISLYECYIETKNVYPEESEKLYSSLRHRPFIVLAYHIAYWIRAFTRKFHEQ